MTILSKLKATIVFSLIFATANSQNMKNDYPSTKKVNHTDQYFGTSVSDPYRWLEDDRVDDTKDWVARQVDYTNRYLSKIPYRESIRKQLTDIWNYEKVSAPFKEGNYTYFYKNNGLQAQSVLYRTDKSGKTEVFLDPNLFSKDGTTSLSGVSFNKKGNLVAYAVSEGGSDWNKIFIMDAVTKKILDEPIISKFSGMSWLGDQGFYYSKYDHPKEGSMLSGMTDMHKIYFHKLGTKSSEDQLVIGSENFKRRYLSAAVSEDQRFLILSAANATSGNELYIKDLSKKNSEFVPIQSGFNNNTSFVDNQGETLFFTTNKNAPNQKLVKASLKNPTVWTDVIAETDNVLSITTGGGYFFAEYMKDAVSYFQQFDYSGKHIRDISLPAAGSGGGFSGKTNEKELYYSFTNYIMPTTIFKFNAESGKSELYYKPEVKFNTDNYVSEQIFYTSADGTKIPMMISYKKGLKKDGKNPTMVYGYGGFNVSLTPSFSVTRAIWMENGGILAVPNIRGGGEYGKKWHDAGTKLQKKNVFNDFIAAAEYLQKQSYTSPQYTALSGASNGGLLVGAVMTMRPNLAKVALPSVGVLDMLRYNKFTAGAGWAYDYGTAEDSKEMFNYLLSYSPLHNVKKRVCYPSTMITTGDHDDRVVPAHSFKFGAELQEKQGCKNPILMRIAVNAGHGAGRSTEQIISENTDVQSFTLNEMGIKKIENR